MNKEVEIKISPDDAKGLKFGSEIRATVVGTIKSIKEEKEVQVPVAAGDNVEPTDPEVYVCVEIEPATIKIGGNVIDGGNSTEDKFNKDYKNYLGLKKSMENKGKAARANGETIVGE